MSEQVPAYTVIGTEDEQTYVPQKGTIRVKRIHVRFADGTMTFVEVPLTPDWAQQAQAAIEEHHAQHQELMSIQAPMVPAPPQQRPTRPLGT